MKLSRTAKDASVLSAFFKYVVPSVLAFALSGVYAIVDGFFVGQSIGDKGLSAINVAFPVVSLIQSLGTGIGMGGAVLWSVRRGERTALPTAISARLYGCCSLRAPL